jgi:hypothetical protein
MASVFEIRLLRTLIDGWGGQNSRSCDGKSESRLLQTAAIEIFLICVSAVCEREIEKVDRE